MATLSRRQLARACQIFLDLAYPGGPETIPPRKRPYYNIDVNGRIDDYLTPAPLAKGICEKIGTAGYSFRLGSSWYPHLKLRVQHVKRNGIDACVFSVDTHDAFWPENAPPPADHPDAAHWRALQMANSELKRKIETAWEQAGLLTHAGLLRQELAGTSLPQDPPSPVPAERGLGDNT
ncbi:MAG: hypothetical protein NZO58_04980 [Gemmataceae bacterium]|nr:hypothetical protein [Gemmataceae bacterium]